MLRAIGWTRFAGPISNTTAARFAKRRLNNAAHNATNALAAITVALSICSSACACVSIIVANAAVTTAAAKNANSPIMRSTTTEIAAASARPFVTRAKSYARITSPPMLDGKILPKNNAISEKESKSPSVASISCARTKICHFSAPRKIAAKYIAVASSSSGTLAWAMMFPTSRKSTRVKINASKAIVTRIFRRLTRFCFIDVTMFQHRTLLAGGRFGRLGFRLDALGRPRDVPHFVFAPFDVIVVRPEQTRNALDQRERGERVHQAKRFPQFFPRNARNAQGVHRGNLVAVLAHQMQMSRIVATALHNKLAQRFGTGVIHHCIGRVANLEPAPNHQRFDKRFIHRHIGGQIRKDFAKRDKFAEARNFETQFMLHLETQMR